MQKFSDAHTELFNTGLFYVFLVIILWIWSANEWKQFYIKYNYVEINYL